MRRFALMIFAFAPQLSFAQSEMKQESVPEAPSGERESQTSESQTSESQTSESQTSESLKVPDSSVTENKASNLAQSDAVFECEKGNQKRIIKVIYDSNSPKRVPCRVVLQKEGQDEAEPKEVWNARFEPFFCDNKANAFIFDKHVKQWNWKCAQTSGNALQLTP